MRDRLAATVSAPQPNPHNQVHHKDVVWRPLNRLNVFDLILPILEIGVRSDRVLVRRRDALAIILVIVVGRNLLLLLARLLALR